MPPKPLPASHEEHMCDCKPDADPHLGTYCVNCLAPTARYNACPMKVPCVVRYLLKNDKFPGHQGDFTSITENGGDECDGWQNHVYGQSDGTFTWMETSYVGE